jgi:diguanylate cyclase (GGDEF)-like protein
MGFAKLKIERDREGQMHFRFSQVNEAFERIVGLDVSMLAGKSFTEILADSLEPDCGLHGFCQRACAAGRVESFQEEITCNGCDFRVHALTEGEEKLVLLLEDISELVRLREEFQAGKEALEGMKDRLYRESITDEMTGLFNRKHIMELLDKELARAERGMEALTMAMLDIDAFKTVNETYGHQFGDYVLKAFSDALVDQVRTMDYVGRYGGEEFLLIFPGTRIGDAVEILDRIESMLSVNEFRKGEAAVTLQFSAGVVEYKGESMDYLIRRADDLLHRAKAKGKSHLMMS